MEDFDDKFYINLFMTNITTIGNLETMSSRFSCNAEVSASALQENLEEMFPWYYMSSTDPTLQPHTGVLSVAKEVQY